MRATSGIAPTAIAQTTLTGDAPVGNDHEQVEQDEGKSEEGIEDPHQDVINDAAEVAGDQAEAGADQLPDQHGQWGQREDQPRTPDQPAEDVAAEEVGAEEVGAAGRLKRHADQLGWRVGRDYRGKERHHDPSKHDQEACRGELRFAKHRQAAPQPHPAPWQSDRNGDSVVALNQVHCC